MKNIGNSTNKTALWLVAALAGGILLVGIPTHVLSSRPKLSAQKLDTMTVPVQLENLAIEITASGTVEPVQSVNISPKTPGRLTKLLVEQGDTVQQGQKLAIMDNNELYAKGMQSEAQVKQGLAQLRETQTRILGDINQAEARFTQAEAKFNQAKARYQQEAASIPKEMDQANAKVVAAQSDVKRTQDKVTRYDFLVKQGAVAQDVYDASVNEFQNAQARLFEAQQYLEQLKNTADPRLENLASSIDDLSAAVVEAQIVLEQKRRTAEPELSQIAASIQKAEAQRQESSVQFTDSIITAPFSGVVTQKYATEGAFVTPTTSASSTASATSSSILALAKGLEIVAKVPEVDIRQIQLGQEVHVVADAYPDKIFRGKVILIAPEAVVEQNVTAFEVRIALLSGRQYLRSKMNVDVKFLGPQVNNTLTVPTVAVVSREGQTGVLVPNADSNKPEFKAIKLGVIVGDRAQILSGVEPGDRVFIDIPEDKDKKKAEEKK